MGCREGLHKAEQCSPEMTVWRLLPVVGACAALPAGHHLPMVRLPALGKAEDVSMDSFGGEICLY